MSALGRPWRRWAVAAPAGTFLVAVFVLAPGGIPAIGMPSALEVGAGRPAAPAASDPAGSASHRAGKPATPAAAVHRTGRLAHGGSSPTPPASTSSAGGDVTVVSAPQPVVVTTGSGPGEPGDDGNPSHNPSPSSTPSPSPTGSWGGGPGDE